MGLFSRTKNINTKEIKTRRPRKLIVYGQTNQASLETWVEAERRMANSRLRRQRAEGLGKEELAHLEALFKEPNLGLTIPQQEFHIYTEGELQDIVTHAEEPCAPQYYKGDWPEFPANPRQQQVAFAGNMAIPLPKKDGMRFFIQKELELLSQTTFVRNFHVYPEELQAQLREEYWPKRKLKAIAQNPHKMSENDSWVKHLAGAVAGLYDLEVDPREANSVFRATLNQFL